MGFNGQATLVRHWDGSAWSRVPSPTVAGKVCELESVTVAGPDDVWAVGDASGGETLIEHWDGTSWSVVPGVNPGNATNRLTSVSAVGPDDVWAVGYYGDEGQSTKSLALHWNGSRWSRSTLFKRPYGHLGGVVAIAADDAWGVGEQSSQRSVATHWNGSGWAKFSTPNRGGALTNLTAVDAVAPDDVWAVGYYNTADGNRPITVHWDGTEWGVVSSPSPGAAALYSLSAVSSQEVWAVGGDQSGPEHTLAQYWNGTAWTAVDTPALGRASVFKGVSALSSSFAVAVGYTTSRGTEARVLAEFWDGTSWARGLDRASDN